MMMVDLAEYIGEIRNDTGVHGKAFIFNVMDGEDRYECIFFVHPTVDSFVSLSQENATRDRDAIRIAILERYPQEKLLTA